MPCDNVLTTEQVLQKLRTPTKSNLQQDQPTTEFVSDFNYIYPDYDQTLLPTPIVNPKNNQTPVHAISHTSELKKDNDVTNDFCNVFVGG